MAVDSEIYNLHPIAVGSPAPDIALQGMGIAVQHPLSHYYSERGLLLILVRHWNCIFCRGQLADLHTFLPLLEQKTRVVVVMPHKAEYLRTRLTGRYSLRCTVLCDPEYTLYRALGYGHMRASDAISPRAIVDGAKLFFGGHLVGMPDGDVEQLPGVVAIRRSGVVAARHQHAFASDYLTSDELLEFAALAGS
jgi:peroxiredoxin